MTVGGDESDVSLALDPGKRFRFRFRLRCVRACEQAKLRARDDSSVARARHTNLWGPSIRPSVCPSNRLTFRTLEVLTDDMRSIGGADDFSIVVSCSRVCFVRVLSVHALLDRGLVPRCFYSFSFACSPVFLFVFIRCHL